MLFSKALLFAGLVVPSTFASSFHDTVGVQAGGTPDADTVKGVHNMVINTNGAMAAAGALAAIHPDHPAAKEIYSAMSNLPGCVFGRGNSPLSVGAPLQDLLTGDGAPNLGSLIPGGELNGVLCSSPDPLTALLTALDLGSLGGLLGGPSGLGSDPTLNDLITYVLDLLGELLGSDCGCDDLVKNLLTYLAGLVNGCNLVFTRQQQCSKCCVDSVTTDAIRKELQGLHP